MYTLDHDGLKGGMAISYLTQKETPVQLFKSILIYHLNAGFDFTRRVTYPPHGEECKSNYSFLECVFVNSKQIKRDLTIMYKLGCIKALKGTKLEELVKRVENCESDQN